MGGRWLASIGGKAIRRRRAARREFGRRRLRICCTMGLPSLRGPLWKTPQVSADNADLYFP